MSLTPASALNRIDQLPVDVLVEHVIARLPTKQRAHAALVSRSWADAVRQCSRQVWREASLGKGQPDVSCAQLSSLLSWAARNSGAVQRLRLLGALLSQGCDMTFAVLGHLTALQGLAVERVAKHGLTEALLATLSSLAARPGCALLRCLSLHMFPSTAALPQLAATLRSLTALQELSLILVDIPWSWDQDAADGAPKTDSLLVTIGAACPGLRRLRLVAQPRMDVAALPDTLVANTHLVSLQLMHCAMRDVRRLPPNLRDLVLFDGLSGENAERRQPRWGVSLPRLSQLTALRTSVINTTTGYGTGLVALELQSQTWPAEQRPQAGGVGNPPRLFLDMAAATKLRSVHLVNCAYAAEAMPHLTAALDSLPKLRILGLERCRLAELPPMACLSRLTLLSLSHNALTTAPPALAAAVKIEILDLSENPFAGEDGCPEGGDLVPLEKLTSLRELRLSVAPQHEGHDPWASLANAGVLEGIRRLLVHPRAAVLTDEAVGGSSLKLHEYDGQRPPQFELDYCWSES